MLLSMRALPAIVAALFCSSPLVAQDFDTRGWFKGNTHTHTLWSDGNDFPEMILAWYRDHDYDFVGLSDHNVLQEGKQWIALETIRKRQRAIGRDAISKCEARFGEAWIEWETVDDKKGIVLKTLDQCREALEKPGEFHLLMAEEISNSGLGKPVHINALNLEKVIPPVKDAKATPREVMRRSLIDIKEYAEESGRAVIAHVNHPNFQWSLTAEDLANVEEASFFEVYNGHPGVNHLGDETRPGEEAIWDIANQMRLGELGYPPLLGVATDDSHTYHGGDVSPGRGWVMVGAEKLDGDSIVKAMQEGKYYSSSGVTLDAIRYNEEAAELTVEITEVEGVEFTTRFIGVGAEGKIEQFGEVSGNTARQKMPEGALYMRATVTSSRVHPNPSFEGQREQAWIQPIVAKGS